jgi:hypothetical protein
LNNQYENRNYGTTMKKEKQTPLLANNKNTKHNKCKMVASFTPHDVQLSLVVAPSISPKPLRLFID